MVTLRQPTRILDSETVKQHIDDAIALVEKDILRVDRKVSFYALWCLLPMILIAFRFGRTLNSATRSTSPMRLLLPSSKMLGSG